MRRFIFAGLVGLSVMLSDVAFHYLAVEPFETPAYFGAKFVFTFIIGALLYEAPLILGAVVGSLVFTGLMSAWYYLAYVWYSPAMSSCIVSPTYNCTIRGIPDMVYFHLGGYPVTAVTFIEGIVHA